MRHNILLFLLLWISVVSAVNVVPHEHPENWNDTARVAIIWNDGTGNDEMPTEWAPEINTGDIGRWTKEYVVEALYHLNANNIKEYYGKQSSWESLDLAGIRKDFNGAYPHVIVYVNAGYEWGQEFAAGNKPKEPYTIITEAADKGVGIVAVGDDAAFDAKYMLPLTGPGGKGSPIQYDAQYPGMGGAFNYAYADDDIKSLWLWMDKKADQVDEGGLLWEVPETKLFFKELEKNGRGQSDADLWDVDTSKLDDFFMLGYQQATTFGQVWYEGKAGDPSDKVGINKIGNRPGDTVGPVTDTYQKGFSYSYIALAGLQVLNHRVAMIGYQPQYLADEDASSQIVYNAVYWASKAHEKLQISKPKADPPSGSIQTVDNVTLSVSYPKNKDIYDIYYTIDGSTPTVINGIEFKSGDLIPLPKDQGAVTLKAIAFSNRPNDWIDSEMLEVTYTDDKQKIDAPEANPASGKIHEISTIELTVKKPTESGLYTIYYTLDGSTPSKTNGTKYTVPFSLPADPDGDITLKAIALSEDLLFWEDSDVSTFTYELDQYKIDPPKANPASGKVHEIDKITLTVDNPDDESLYTIYYTLDGKIPTKADGEEYTGPFSLPEGAKADVVLNAIAFTNKEGQWLDSDMSTFVYDHIRRKIDTPKADPGSGTTQSVKEITLTVDKPHDSLWTIYYTLDGSTPTRKEELKYTGTFDFPSRPTADVTLKAIAFSDDTDQWFDSDMLEVTYTYVGGPLIDSAIFKPAAIEDFTTSARKDDTLTVYFNTPIEKLDTEWPFMFKDSDNDGYTMKVDDQDYDGKRVTFIVEDINGKGVSYLPENMKDSIAIDPEQGVTSKDGIVQDGSNNFYVPMKVLPLTTNLVVKSVWIDGEDTQISEIIEGINGYDLKHDKGVLITVDPQAALPKHHYERFKCEAKILDPVGNVVATSEGLERGNKLLRSTITLLNGRPQVAISWSAQNTLKRQVGSGAYVVIISFTDHVGKTYVRKPSVMVPRDRK